MTNSEDGRSMDDVLASLRRIVRAEQDSGAGAGPVDTMPTAGHGPSGDEPLALTPEMRLDVAGDAAPESGAADQGGGVAAAPEHDTLRELVREILVEELTSGRADSILREIVRDELMNGEIASNVSQNVVRLVESEVAKAREQR